MLQRRERILGGRCSSDLQTEPSLSLAACNPSHGKILRAGGGRGGGEEEEEGRLSCECEPIPGAGLMKNQKKEKRWWRKDVPPG